MEESTMSRQHLISLAAAFTVACVTGCGYSPVGSAGPMVRPAAAKPVLSRQHVPMVTPAAVRKVNEQHTALTIQAPQAHAGNGSVAMEFVFPKTGYTLQAKAADINKITVTLKTRSFLLLQTVATAEVLRSQIVNGRAAVNFTGLSAGAYTIDILAHDAANNEIGSGSTTANVVDGQTTMVEGQLKLIPDPVTPVGTGLGVNVSIIDG
jgi:hypothetical protein